MEKIKKKLAFNKARTTITNFIQVEFIAFEEDADYLASLEDILKGFRKIGSQPTYTTKSNNPDYMNWIEESTSFLKTIKEWVILVPNSELPVWANVRVLNFSHAIRELVNISESGEFIIADKSSGYIVQLFVEENNYEIHIGKLEK